MEARSAGGGTQWGEASRELRELRDASPQMGRPRADTCNAGAGLLRGLQKAHPSAVVAAEPLPDQVCWPLKTKDTSAGWLMGRKAYQWRVPRCIEDGGAKKRSGLAVRGAAWLAAAAFKRGVLRNALRPMSVDRWVSGCAQHVLGVWGACLPTPWTFVCF